MWILILVLYSYSNGENSSHRPSTMSTDTIIMEFNTEQSCTAAGAVAVKKFFLDRQDRMGTGVRADAICVKKVSHSNPLKVSNEESKESI